MTLPRSSLAALVAVTVAFAAAPAHAQPVTPGPDAPLPPSAQPLAPVQPAPVQQAPAPGAPAPLPGPPAVAPGPYVMVPYTPAGWTPPDTDHTPPSNWYGWQTLVATAPFDIAMFVALSHYSDPTGAKVFGTMFAARNLVPAVVHWAHGRTGRGFGSIGLMAAMSATGVAVGYIFGLALQAKCPPIDPCRNNPSVPPEAGYGAIGGSMAGTLLDVLFFGHRQRLTWTAAKNEPAWGVTPFANQSTVGMTAALQL